jgi:hypothetical protein
VTTTHTGDEGATLDLPEGYCAQDFAPGQVLGERYQVRSLPRPRRDGRGVARLRPQAAGRGGAEGTARGPLQVRAAARAAAAGGQRRPRGGLAERLPHLRPHRGRGPRAGVDGVRGRRDAARGAPGARPPRAEGGSGHRLAVPGRAGGDPQGGPHPPRHQAGEHHAHPRRPGGGDGLRPRPAGDGGRRHGLRHPCLHGPRAGGGPDARREGRRLRRGGRARRDGVPRRHQEHPEPAERVGGRALGACEGPRHAVGAGDQEGRRQGPRGALPLRPHPDPRPRGRHPPRRGRRGPPPLPRPRLLHRGRRRVLLRPRGRGRADVAQARGPPDGCWPGRAVGGGQDLVPARRPDPSCGTAGWATTSARPARPVLGAGARFARTRRRRPRRSGRPLRAMPTAPALRSSRAGAGATTRRS